MHAKLMLPALGAALVRAQGAGEGYPPPPPQTLSTTKSGVLPVIPTATPFAGVETNEGAIVYDGPANPSFMPVNGPATTAAGLPAATYVANLPSTNFDDGLGSTVTGSIMISSTSGGSGVNVAVNFTGFPSEASYGPFVYHIHALAVPADGNCSATMGHLDPTDRGEYYPCNVGAPATCQVGDLSGKHGNITASTFMAQYADPFLSTDPSSPAFFGDKSVVIHTENATRITCANFMMIGGGASAGNGTMMPNGTYGGGNGSSPSSPTMSSPPAYTGGAAQVAGWSAAGLMAMVAAFVL